MQRAMISYTSRILKDPKTLLWLIPILIGCGVFLTICINPSALKDRLFFPVLIMFGLIAPVGGLWAIYRCIRYEKTPWRYIAIVVFIPFGFLWYYFEKYRQG